MGPGPPHSQIRPWFYRLKDVRNILLRTECFNGVCRKRLRDCGCPGDEESSGKRVNRRFDRQLFVELNRQKSPRRRMYNRCWYEPVTNRRSPLFNDHNTRTPLGFILMRRLVRNVIDTYLFLYYTNSSPSQTSAAALYLYTFIFRKDLDVFFFVPRQVHYNGIINNTSFTGRIVPIYQYETP